MNQGAWFSSQHHMRQVVREHNRDLYLRVRRTRGLGSARRRLHRAAPARSRTS